MIYAPNTPPRTNVTLNETFDFVRISCLFLNLATLVVQVTIAKRMTRAEFCELFYSWATVFLNLLEFLRILN